MKFYFLTILLVGNVSLADNFKITAEFPIVQQNLEVLVTTGSCIHEGTNSCYLNQSAFVTVPKGGQIIGALTQINGVTVDFRKGAVGLYANAPDVLDALMAAGRLKVTLIYQGPQLQQPRN